MPELPEVETVCRGLKAVIEPGASIAKLNFLSPALRYPMPYGRAPLVVGKKIRKIFRRAKYLLFSLEDQLLVSHLGMTGSWRLKAESMKHDHIELTLGDGRIFSYRDPRRFGQFDIIPLEGWEEDRRFTSLGPEPLDERVFTPSYLFKKAVGRKVPVKSFIMDQRVVVGVGNIYASEALFWAKIHPLTLAGEVSLDDFTLLVAKIRDVLADAIAAGGTTISDFRQAGGSDGYFQNQLFVYGSDGEECPVCDELITSTVLGGRSTYWCSNCQVLS